LWLALPAFHSQSAVLRLAMHNCLIGGVFALIGGLAFPLVVDRKTLDRFYVLLKTPVGREGELAEQGINVVYAGHSEGHPWELKHPRAVNLGGFLIALVFSFAILLILYVLSRIGA
jgi:hypothetical protein